MIGKVKLTRGGGYDPSKPFGPGNGKELAHEWIFTAHRGWEFCKVCGIVRRADDKNSPCKGPTKICVREMEKV